MSVALAAVPVVGSFLGSLFGGGGQPFVFQSPSVGDLKRVFSSPSLGDAVTLFGPIAGRRVWREYQCTELGTCPEERAPTPRPEAPPSDPSDERSLAEVLAGLGAGGGFELPDLPRTRVGLAPAEREVSSPFAPFLILAAVAVIGFYLYQRTKKAG